MHISELTVQWTYKLSIKHLSHSKCVKKLSERPSLSPVQRQAIAQDSAESKMLCLVAKNCDCRLC